MYSSSYANKSLARPMGSNVGSTAAASASGQSTSATGTKGSSGGGGGSSNLFEGLTIIDFKRVPASAAKASAGTSTTTITTAPTDRERDRPSTLNLPGSSSTAVGSGGTSSNLIGNLPNKPSRYTPVYPTLATGKSTSYSNLPGGSGGGVIGGYAPYRSQQQQQQGQGQTEVITVPPKSIMGQQGQQSYEQQQQHQYYQPGQFEKKLQQQQEIQQRQQLQLQQQHQLQLQQQRQLLSSSNTNLSAVSSKSAHNLMETLPDVFCLSCPPAEFKFSDAYRAKTLPRSGKENERQIGFSTLPEQVHRKSVKKGFDFTLMVVGESGLGKSTLINSLFLADFYQNRKLPSASDLIKKTTTIQKHSIEIEERGVKLRLTVVDTPGFGDSINCRDSWKACTDYVDDQFRQYFDGESGLNRKHILDGRVHCCLYFVPPYGRGLRQLDIEALKNLQSRCNVIPVIGKADTLTPSEVRELKDKILDDLRTHHIQIYQFPECDEEEDEEFKRQDRELKAALPFAVASSDTFVEIGGKRIRGRVYPWGIVEVDNPNHSDFGKLRTMLIQSHMHDLKETTQDLHYENFRAKAIAQIAQNPRERSKLKRDSSSDSTHDMLLEKEAEIKRMQKMISKMEAKLKAAQEQEDYEMDI